MHEQKTKRSQAGHYSTTSISAFISPILGKLVDRYGCRAIVACLAPLCLLFVHTLLGLTRIDPIVILLFQGIAYAAFAAVTWPSIPLVVEERYTGKYAVILTFNNSSKD